MFDRRLAGFKRALETDRLRDMTRDRHVEFACGRDHGIVRLAGNAHVNLDEIVAGGMLVEHFPPGGGSRPELPADERAARP